MMSQQTQLPINRYLDHAVLKPELSRKDAVEAIRLGITHDVMTVCVRPCDIDLAVNICQGSHTSVSCVLNFPHGVGLPEIKAEEARQYIARGVKELDMVVNYGWIKSAQWDLVEQDIRAVSSVSKPANIVLKVILETAMLTLDEVAQATEIAIQAQADFVKTSTGFNGGGATEEIVQVMLKTAGGRIQVKPSGGIRDYQRAKMFVDMGVRRLGVNYPSTPIICSGAVSQPAADSKGY